MDVISFIEKDVRRNQAGLTGFRVSFGLALALMPAVLGLGLRDEAISALSVRVFIPNLAASFGLLFLADAFVRRVRGKQLAGAVGLISAAVLVLATERLFFPIAGRTVYGDESLFWHESMKCFSKGVMTSSLESAWVLAIAWIAFPWVTRRLRLVAALIIGLTSSVMLGFHCDSSNWSHVLVGHVLPGFLVGSCLWILWEALSMSSLGRQFPELSGRLRQFWKID